MTPAEHLPSEQSRTAPQGASKRRVAIVIPTLNEATHIGSVLDALAVQAPEDVVEILVVDGGSSDGTQKIVSDRNLRDARIQLINNPARIQAAAVNLAALRAHPKVTLLIRADAHAEYPPDFVQRLVDAYAKTGAQSVTNRLESMGASCFQRAVAAASNSRIGAGGAVHRTGGTSGFVAHGHHALFDKEWFLRLGGYDDRYIANEDAEYDYRLREAGGRIWFENESVIRYFPRDTPSALWRQYYRYGRGRAQNRRKHGEALQPRQLLPVVLVLITTASAVAATVRPWFLAAPIGYLTLVFAAAALFAWRDRDACLLGSSIALPVMHFGWGVGFLRETASTLFQRR